MEGVQDYSIVLFGHKNPTTQPTHCGTGTLVKSSGRHYILTAAHCAARLTDYKKIGLPIRPAYPLIVQRLDPIFIEQRKEDAWGPDLAFIPMSAVDVSNFTAFSMDKRFYDLDKYAAQILKEVPKVAWNVWSLVGSPDLLSSVSDTRHLQLQMMVYKATVRPSIRRGKYDYVEIRVPLKSPNALRTFQGVSGGGVWRRQLTSKPDGSLDVVGPHLLVGCAFYETQRKGKSRYIRCHGWRSIYEMGLSELRR
jgi:hypothetical protein